MLLIQYLNLTTFLLAVMVTQVFVRLTVAVIVIVNLMFTKIMIVNITAKFTFIIQFFIVEYKIINVTLLWVIVYLEPGM